MKQAITFLSLLLALVSSAQTCYYINALAIQPANPTDQDPVSILVSGDLSSGGAYITQVQTNVDLGTNVIDIEVSCTDPGGIAVLVPKDTLVFIGTLPGGEYFINVSGMGISVQLADPMQQFIEVAGLQNVHEHQHPFMIKPTRDGYVIDPSAEVTNIDLFSASGGLVRSFGALHGSLFIPSTSVPQGVSFLRISTPYATFTRKLAW